MRTFLLWLALLAVSWGDGRDPAAVLKKYGHQLEGQASVQPLEVPSPLGGPAFTHYQSCSQQVGLSLEPLYEYLFRRHLTGSVEHIPMLLAYPTLKSVPSSPHKIRSARSR